MRRREQQISYHAPGPPFAWYWATIHTLEEQQWTLRTPLRPDLAGPSYNPIIPLRFERVSVGFLVDELVLEPDQRNPNLARMRLKRRIAIPCRQCLWRLLTETTADSARVAAIAPALTAA
jgi:hypothetical protein